MLRRNWGQGNDLMSRVRDLMEYEVHTRDGARRGYPAFVSRDECKTLIFFIDRVQELVNYLLRSRSSRPSAYEIRDHAAALDFPDWRRYLRQIELPLYADDDDRHILRLRGGLPARRRPFVMTQPLANLGDRDNWRITPATRNSTSGRSSFQQRVYAQTVHNGVVHPVRHAYELVTASRSELRGYY